MQRYQLVYASGLSGGLTFASLLQLLASINWPGLVVFLANLGLSLLSLREARRQDRREDGRRRLLDAELLEHRHPGRSSEDARPAAQELIGIRAGPMEGGPGRLPARCSIPRRPVARPLPRTWDRSGPSPGASWSASRALLSKARE